MQLDVHVVVIPRAALATGVIMLMLKDDVLVPSAAIDFRDFTFGYGFCIFEGIGNTRFYQVNRYGCYIHHGFAYGRLRLIVLCKYMEVIESQDYHKYQENLRLSAIVRRCLALNYEPISDDSLSWLCVAYSTTKICIENYPAKVHILLLTSVEIQQALATLAQNSFSSAIRRIQQGMNFLHSLCLQYEPSIIPWRIK